MTYLQFREQWHNVGCFNIYQVRAVCPRFDRGNLGHWVKKGYLARLRQDWYAFAGLAPSARVFALHRTKDIFTFLY